jgi:rRNA pseudouridine-1189 N-methylase Emg1 (Nep1/Mra1 family)
VLDVIGCYREEEMDVEKFILLVKDHEAIFDASRCEHRNRDYIASVWEKIAQEMGEGKEGRFDILFVTLMMTIFITMFI